MIEFKLGNKFQFLIGILKTTCTFKHPDCSLAVSIPHRYAKNIPGGLKAPKKGEFQFLIGTLKTSICPNTLKCPFKFQFLIGTLKTTDNIPLAISKPGFNSS